MGQFKRFWYLSHRQAAKAEVSLRQGLGYLHDEDEGLDQNFIIIS